MCSRWHSTWRIDGMTASSAGLLSKYSIVWNLIALYEFAVVRPLSIMNGRPIGMITLVHALDDSLIVPLTRPKQCEKLGSIFLCQQVPSYV